MTTLQTDTLDISTEEWERLAELANLHDSDGQHVTAEQLRESYVSAMQGEQEDTGSMLVAERPKPKVQANGDIHVGPYEIKLYTVFTLGIEGDFRPGTDWTFDFKAYLKVLGKTVWTTSYRLSREESSISYHPSVYLAKGDFTIGIFGDSLCLRTFGDACYRAPFGSWHCKSFDVTLHCFK